MAGEVTTRSARWHADGVANILGMWESATAEERSYGADWYEEANSIAQMLAVRFGVTLETAAGVIAALSPNVRWEANVGAAYRLLKAATSGQSLDSFKVPTYGKNKRAAWAIAHGVAFSDAFSDNARKVRAFYSLICDPAAETVCVDTHAYNLWRGQYQSVSDTETVQGKLWLAVAQDYCRAAAVAGVAPSTMQAATWLAYKRLNADRMDKSLPRAMRG